jgi:hypothetical protein
VSRQPRLSPKPSTTTRPSREQRKASIGETGFPLPLGDGSLNERQVRGRVTVPLAPNSNRRPRRLRTNRVAFPILSSKSRIRRAQRAGGCGKAEGILPTFRCLSFVAQLWGTRGGPTAAPPKTAASHVSRGGASGLAWAWAWAFALVRLCLVRAQQIFSERCCLERRSSGTTRVHVEWHSPFTPFLLSDGGVARRWGYRPRRRTRSLHQHRSP